LLLAATLLVFLPTGISQRPYFGCFSDSHCNSALSSIDWGELNPGESVSYSFYVQNHADAVLTGLSCQMLEVIPEQAENFLSLGYSLSIKSLSKNEFAEVDLTLKVDPSIHDIKEFSFDVLVTASFSESSDGGTEPTDGSAGWEGPDHNWEDTVEIPPEDEGLSSGQQMVLIAALFVCVYLFLGKK
jgi:hypothetical protein